MKQQETIWLLTFLAIVSWSSAHIGGSHVGFQRVDPQVYCGRNLANILAQLCEEVNKRSDDGALFKKILSPYNKERDIVWPWIAHHKTRALGLSWRGKRHEDDGGIVNECCENPCSTDELLQYC